MPGFTHLQVAQPVSFGHHMLAWREMLLRDRELCKKVGLEVQAKRILQRSTQSELRALPAKATSVEGVQPSLAILDEVHAARGRELYDTLSTACAKTASGLLLMVTTAGNDSAGLGYTFADLQFHVERFLSAAKMTPEQVFETMWATRDDWERILNYTIAAAAERLQKKAKSAAAGGK